MDDFYMDIRKFIKENYSEYKESIETEENNYDIKNSKKTNENIENEEKYRNLYNNYKKLSEKIYGKNDI
jgi:hypothetical protein